MSHAIRMSEEQLAEYLQRRLKAPREAGPPVAVRKPSLIVLRWEQQLAEHGVAPYVREFFAISGRDFRLDYAWPFERIGVEIQGLQHRINGRFKADIEKRALHLLAGWRVLELDGKTVRDGRGIKWLKELLP